MMRPRLQGKRELKLAHGRLSDRRRPCLIHLTEPLHQAAVQAADVMDVSLSALTRAAVEEFLLRHAKVG
jgi:hypothetical protein